MRSITRLISIALLVGFASQPLLALDGKKAQYIGGTVAGAKEGAEGRLDTSNDSVLVFTTDKMPRLEIPYASIAELEYGQKAGRRVGAVS